MVRRSLVISLAVHGAVLGLLMVSLPLFPRNDPEAPAPIPVEIFDIAEVTNTRVAEKPVPRPAPVPEPPKPPAEPKKPDPEPPKAPPPPKQEPPKPEPKKPEPPPKPVPAPPSEEGTQKPPEKKPAAEKKPDKPVPEKKNEDGLASIMKGLRDLKPTPRPMSEADRSPETAATPGASTSRTPALASDRLSTSEMDALKRQLVGCWNFPAGAKDAQNLVVDVIVEVNPDRTVKSAEISDTGRSRSDNFYRTAAESARRAVLQCQPLLLPPGKYDTWQKMTIQFDPKELL
ncbi:MAG: energy transducer TonB [Pseudomonadota bacterium]|nr:energy transducer TonB [Pseudomonadota bacterium]